MGLFRKVAEFAAGVGYGVTNPVEAVKYFFEPETCELRGCGERATGHTTCCRQNLCARHGAAWERDHARCGRCPIPGCGRR